MSFFDKLSKIVASTTPKTSQDYISYITKTYYRGYPQKPYISPTRDFEDWLAKVEGLNGVFQEQMLVSLEMMYPLPNGLLAGEVYLLYWLGRFTDKEVPAYFEYKYGIDVEASKIKLQNSGYLDSNFKPTKQGNDTIIEYWDIITEHTPKALKPNEKRVKVKAVPAVVGEKKPVAFALSSSYGESAFRGKSTEKYVIEDVDFPVIQKSFDTLNGVLPSGCVLSLGDLRRGELESYIIKSPKTPSGKDPKYPVMLRLQIGDPLSHKEVIGNIYYYPDNTIGRAELNFWKDKHGDKILIVKEKNDLVIKKIEEVDFNLPK